MDATLKRANELRQALIDWVYDAQGEVAVALETYAAENGGDRYDIKLQNLMVNTFLSEGRVGDKSPIELFIEQSELSQSDRALLSQWRRSFTGLFEIKAVRQGFDVNNWLTAKHYTVFPNPDIPQDELKRLQPGEIILARIMPITEQEWMISGSCLLKGKLGKPKLAVAIGEFKQNYPAQLYADAPQLLEQAWDSVAQYHQEFTDFFESDRVTLSGYELNKKIAQLQQQMSQKRLAAVGIDSSKSLKQLAQESGVDEAELTAAVVDESGTDSNIAATVEKALNAPMVTPKVDLPPEIKNAQQVTAFSHPRWGQMFIPSYTQFEEMLTADSSPNQDLVQKYLKDEKINFYIWQCLKQQYPTQLEKALQTVCGAEFDLERDLEPTLLQYNKKSQPELPEIASVPLHLHNLFEEAVAQVQTKTKGKKTQKKAKGFQ